MRAPRSRAPTTRLRVKCDNVARTSEATHLQLRGELGDHVEAPGFGGAAEGVRKGSLDRISHRQQSRNLTSPFVVLSRLFRVVYATIDD
jgi:hypothetical protein